MTTQIIYASGNPGLLKSQVGVAVLVDSNGNIIDSLGATPGTVVDSLNGLTGALTIAGAGSNVVTVAGSTITVSGSAPAASTSGVSGPGASTNTAIVRWNGTTGTNLLDSNITSNGSNLAFPDGGSITLASNTNPARIGGESSQFNAIYSNRFGSSTGATVLLSGDNGTTIWSSKHLDLFAAQGQVGNFIRTSGSIRPLTSGADSIGQPALIYSSGFFNQYATTRVSGNITATPYSIDWKNGSSNAVGFVNGAITGVTINLVGGIPGSTYFLESYNNASGTANITWGGNIKWQSFASGVPTASGNAADLFTFYCLPNNNYYGMSAYNFL